MQTPVEIEFQGMEAKPQIQAALAKHVADLEQRFGRVTACRVVLKAPGGHHERHSDLEFAINDAFNRARRQLQDRVRELQGKIKHHERPPIGTVVQLDPLGEFGLLESSDGQEIYFHRNSVLDGDYARLAVGSRGKAHGKTQSARMTQAAASVVSKAA